MADYDILLSDTQETTIGKWATVTQASPLRIKVDGDTSALGFTPDTLISPLALNDRVWVQIVDRRLVVLGKSGGITGNMVVTTGHFGGTSGPAVYIGDDAVLVDINFANAIGIQGQQNAANGQLVFGSGNDTNVYRGAANQLKTDDDFVAVGDVYTQSVSVSTMNGLGVSGNSRSSTSASTAAGAESALSTTWSAGTNSMTFKDGFVYMFVFWYQLSDNINSSYSITIPRLYTSGGTNIGGYVHENVANGHLGITYTQIGYVKRIAGSNLTTGVGITVQRYISGIAGTSNIDNAVVTIHELGRVSDHAGPAGMAAAI